MNKAGGLNTLLNYRFVKKRSEKLQSCSSQNNSNTSDGSQSSDCTQSPSQTSTLPPSLDNSQSPPSQTPAVLMTSGSSSVVPETPSSDLPSPDSPVLQYKQKIVGKFSYDTEDTGQCSASSSSSPWLSKKAGPVMNGDAGTSKKKTKIKQRFAESSDEEGATVISSSDSDCEIVDMPSKMNTLRQMFPVKEDTCIKSALKMVDGDLDKTVDILIGTGSGKFKRIREESQDSTDVEVTVVTPAKRFRLDEQGTSANDSQATQPYSLDSQATEPYGLNSQNSMGGTSNGIQETDKEEKITFLMGAFPNYSRRELYKVLEENNWQEEGATTALMSRDKEPKKDVELSDEDENFGSEDESVDSEDSLEEEGDEAKTVKEVILSFFEDASLEELMSTPGCSKKKAELIAQLRPFHTWETMVEKFVTTKGLSYDVITGCREIIRVREVISRLMQKCEKMSEQMETVVANLLRKSSVELQDEDQISKQPALLDQNYQLKPFQLVGLNWLKIMHNQHLNGILADEMGLGKTIQTISFLAHLLEEGEEGPHVIIVPSSTMDNWLRELRVWCPALNVLMYYGSQDDRRATRQFLLSGPSEDYHVILTTYNMVTGSIEDRTLFKKFDFHYAIFDEGHMLKNMSSLRYQNLMRIRAERRLLLTGTPLQNNLLELMSLLCFVMPEMFIGKTEQLKRMFTMISRTGNDEKRSSYEAERIMHAKKIMRPFVLRRLKSEVIRQLPKKLEEVMRCRMIPEQEEVYNNLIQNFKKTLQEKGDEDISGGGSSMLMQLRKAANHPLLHRHHYHNELIQEMSEAIAQEPSHVARGALPNLIAEDMAVMSDFEIMNLCKHYKEYLGDYKLDETVVQDSGKFRKLQEMLDDMKDRGDRVLLFSQFTSLLDIMEVFLKQMEHRYLRLDGSTPVTERQKLIDKFNNDTGIFLFLLSTRAGGLGINLTSANTVIIHDIDFNPYNDKQAEDRCHRVGQTRPVSVIRLISQDTVEEAMLSCAREKLKLEKDLTSSDKDGETDNPKDVLSVLKLALAAKGANS